MNKDIFEGNVKQFVGEAKKQWGELTDDELTEAKGDREKLVGLIQEKYGISKDEAEKQVEDWQEKAAA